MFNDFTFRRDGIEDQRPSSQRIYTYHELTELLYAAGFEVVNAYGSLAQDPFALRCAKRLILISEKQ